MVKSLNTRLDLEAEAIAYVGFPKYGKIMIGDHSLEFYKNQDLKDNIMIPWGTIKRVEGMASKAGKVYKVFYIVLDNGNKIRFSSKESGKILRRIRDKIGSGKVVRSLTFVEALRRLFRVAKRP